MTAKIRLKGLNIYEARRRPKEGKRLHSILRHIMLIFPSPHMGKGGDEGGIPLP